MWLSLAFASAALLGLYDAAKKKALTGNAVLPVLLLNTFFCSLFFLPAILSAECGFGWFDGTVLESSCGTLRAHGLVVLKSAIVLTSWIFGYFGMKHLPLTIVGPINATRPVLVLLGALLIFGERLNASQWAGVLLALVSLFLLGRSSRREGVDFAHNRWILCIAAAALTGAASGLYDKYIMTRLDPVFVQSWYNLYQFLMMAIVVGILWWPRRGHTTPLPLELGHPVHLDLPLGRRLRLPLCPARSRCHDLRRLDDPSRFGRRVVPVRCGAVPRAQPAFESRRSGLHPGGYVLSLAGIPVGSRRASPC